MVELLIRRFIKNSEDMQNPEVSGKIGMLCGIVGIVLNGILFGFKILTGLFSGSVAIVADALNNLSDVGASVISLIGFKLSIQEPDKDHPYGHGRIEYLTGMFIAVMIVLVGAELLKSSVKKIITPVPVETGILTMCILIVAILIKFYMYIYNRKIGKRIQSLTMTASSVDSLGDCLATGVVLLTTIVAYFFEVNLDAWGGTAVSLFILINGFKVLKETADSLLGQPPTKEFVDCVQNVIAEYRERGALGMHDLVVHDYGPGRMMLSVHVEVPAGGDLLELHELIDEMEHRLHKELRCSAVIHMDPICNDDEETMNLRNEVETIVEGIHESLSIHDFRVVRGTNKTNLIFDILIPFGFEKKDKEVVEIIRQEIKKINENYEIVVEIDRGVV